MSLLEQLHQDFCRLSTLLDQEDTRHGVQPQPDEGVMPARWANAGDEAQLALAWALMESRR